MGSPAPNTSIKRCCRIAYAQPAYFYHCGSTKVILLLVGRPAYRTRAARVLSISLIGPGDTNGIFQWVSTCTQPSRGVCVERLPGHGLTCGPLLVERVHLLSQSNLAHEHRALFVRSNTTSVSNVTNLNNRHQRTTLVDPLRPFRPRISRIFLRLYVEPMDRLH